MQTLLPSEMLSCCLLKVYRCSRSRAHPVTGARAKAWSLQLYTRSGLHLYTRSVCHSHGQTLSSSVHCCQKGTSSCAALHPCAATDGTPGPGKLESPTTRKPSSGVAAVVMGMVSVCSLIHPVPP